ncbi:hypothetical protein B0I12_000110 [Microbacterium hydrothermale]|nr:hypothetical protein [Microbacterium hydrothermale]
MTRGSPCASSRSCARLCACGSHGGDPERASQPGTTSAGHRRRQQPGDEREPSDSTGEYPALRHPAPSTTPPCKAMRCWRSDRARAVIRAPTTSRDEFDFQATPCGDARILTHAHHVARTRDTENLADGCAPNRRKPMRRTVSSHRRNSTRRDMAACEVRGGQWAAGPPLSVGECPTRTRTLRVRSSALTTAPTRAAMHLATLSHSIASGAAWSMSVSRETPSAPHYGYVGATRPRCSGSSELSLRRHEKANFH